MGCSTPEAPDIEAMAEVSGDNAELAAAISLEQLDWAKEQFGKQMGVTNRVLNTQLPIMSETHRNAMKDRERYEKVYQPLEDNLVEEFQRYDTKQRQNREAGEAAADVTRSFDAQRANAARQLESYGIDPSQTRHQALDSNMRIQQAAAQAASMTGARRNVEATGRALRAEAINIGKGYPSNVAGSYGQALAAGNSAVGNINATTGVGASTMGTGQGWMGQSNQGAQVGMHGMNQAYANQVAAFGQQTELLGAGLGALGMFGAGIAEGGQVQGPGGPKGDAIPAMLSDEEYVIPAEVMKRKGTEFFDKLVAKTRKDLGMPEEAPPRHIATPDGALKVYTDEEGNQSVEPAGIPMAAEGGSLDQYFCVQYPDNPGCPQGKRKGQPTFTPMPGGGIPKSPYSGPAKDVRDYINKRMAYKQWAQENAVDKAAWKAWAVENDLNPRQVRPKLHPAGKPQLPVATTQRIAGLKQRLPAMKEKYGIPTGG